MFPITFVLWHQDRCFHPKAGISIWDSAALEYKPLPALKDVAGNLNVSRAPVYCKRESRVSALSQSALPMQEHLDGRGR